MNLVAEALRDLNEWPTSVEIQGQALEISRRTLGPNDTFSIKCVNDLANALADGGNFEEAEALQEDAPPYIRTSTAMRTSIHSSA